jgi:hypothetical protein
MVQGPKRRRCKRFHPPTTREAKGEFENYGIITSYNGGAGRYTTVQVYSANESIVELAQVRMKGSITPPKCRQRIAIGSFVLLQYGEIALIYKDSSMIPVHIVMALEGAVNDVEEVARGRTKTTTVDDKTNDDFSDEDDSVEDTDSDDNSNPDFI